MSAVEVRTAAGPSSQWARWWRYNGVALMGVAVQLGTLTLCVEFLRIDYRLGVALAVAAAVTHNFLWHQRWTWCDRVTGSSGVGLLVRYAAANGMTSLAGNIGLTWLLSDLSGVQVLAANATAIVVCGLVNYILADSVVFADGRRRADDRRDST